MADYYLKFNEDGTSDFGNIWNPAEFARLAYYDWPIASTSTEEGKATYVHEKKQKKKSYKPSTQGLTNEEAISIDSD